MKTLIDIDNNIKYQKLEDLLDLPISITVNKFNDDSVNKFSEDMSKAHLTNQPIIPIIIDSYGGEIHGCMSMVSEIQNAKKPVATICVGKAMSAGAILLTCGNDGLRFADKNSYIMIHDVSSATWGKTEEIKYTAEYIEKVNRDVYVLMARNCGKEDNYFLNIIHDKGHAEWFMKAEDAKFHNIINHIRIPDFKVNISLKITME